MNTKAVAELLGISTSTVQRWVKQLNLDMARNEMGHFVFTEEDIELLKEVQKQLQDGAFLQDITIDRKKRTECTEVMNHSTHELKEDIEDRLQQFETKLYQKADSSIITYQLLQHRREIEDLQEQVTELTEKVTKLEMLLEQEAAATKEEEQTSDQLPPRKKKNFFRFLFGS